MIDHKIMKMTEEKDKLVKNLLLMQKYFPQKPFLTFSCNHIRPFGRLVARRSQRRIQSRTISLPELIHKLLKDRKH